MPAQYVKIHLSEMYEFLKPLGFTRIDLGKSINEIVYARGFRGIYIQQEDCYLPLSLRIYTSIDSSGVSRSKGEDAIRVNLWTKIDDTPIMLMGQKRVHRMSNWRTYLQQRIDNWRDMIGELCPKCGAPMLTRIRKSDSKQFLGCIRYPKCNGIRNIFQLE